MDINKHIDHTNLKAFATKKDIEKLCDEAIKYDFASVCVNPYYVSLANELLVRSDVKVCTVVGFPLGATPSDVKAYETTRCIADGADEKEALELRITQLEEKLAQAQKKLDDRAIIIDRAGSIAEASLQLSGIFEAAQRAADQYLENIRQMNPIYTTEEGVETLEQAGNQPLSARRRKRGMSI